MNARDRKALIKAFHSHLQNWSSREITEDDGRYDPFTPYVEFVYGPILVHVADRGEISIQLKSMSGAVGWWERTAAASGRGWADKHVREIVKWKSAMEAA